MLAEQYNMRVSLTITGIEKMGKLEQPIQCSTCLRTFDVTGQDGPNHKVIAFACPYCQSAIKVRWPIAEALFIHYPVERISV